MQPLPSPHRKVRAQIARRPTHVNGNAHHHPVHLDSLVGLPKMDAFHSSARPNEVFIPVIQAIQALAQTSAMGHTYWSWQDSMSHRDSPFDPHQGTGTSDRYFAIPASCCNISELTHP